MIAPNSKAHFGTPKRRDHIGSNEKTFPFTRKAFLLRLSLFFKLAVHLAVIPLINSKNIEENDQKFEVREIFGRNEKEIENFSSKFPKFPNELKENLQKTFHLTNSSDEINFFESNDWEKVALPLSLSQQELCPLLIWKKRRRKERSEVFSESKEAISKRHRRQIASNFAENVIVSVFLN